VRDRANQRIAEETPTPNLHHSHHVSFERLSRITAELFGLTISEGAIANLFRRTGTQMAAAAKVITDVSLR